MAEKKEKKVKALGYTVVKPKTKEEIEAQTGMKSPKSGK